MLWEKRVQVSNDLPIRGGLLRDNKIMMTGHVRGRGDEPDPALMPDILRTAFWWWIAEQPFELC
jgi:hypothetical protein